MRWRLQPYAMEAATLCDGGCSPMCWQVEAAKAKEEKRAAGEVEAMLNAIMAAKDAKDADEKK